MAYSSDLSRRFGEQLANLSKGDRDRFLAEIAKDKVRLEELTARQRFETFEKLKEDYLKALSPSFPTSSIISQSPVFGFGEFHSAPDAPIISPPSPSRSSIDPAKLEKLKESEPYRPLEKVPDYLEVITAWRAWRITSNKGSLRLKALGGDTVWSPKEEILAKCTSSGFSYGRSEGRHLAPDWNCSCGIWAFKSLENLVATIGGGYNGVEIIGNVSLWGRVIETTNGYRSEKAYPSELWLMSDNEELEELSHIYDVPIRRIRH